MHGGKPATQAVGHLTPVIICGGVGTRLWPASRESMPKPFIPLTGERSTFQSAAERISDAEIFARPKIVTHNDGRFVVAEQLAQVGLEADILLEPERRDSALAVAVAAVHAARTDPEGVVLVLAADHETPDAGAFIAACIEAAAGARDGLIMMLGLAPSHPATGCGYVKPGEAVAGEARRVLSFVEKPDARSAERCIAEGFLWNSGCLIFRADVMIEELKRFAPDILEAARASVEGAASDLDFIRLDAAPFARARNVSISHAVMEHTDKAGILPVSFAWSSISTWNALWEASPRDGDGNALRGPVAVVEARNSFVQADGILAAVVGLDDVVVVAEPDAVLVTSRARSHQVEELVPLLRAQGRREANEHRRMYRPWGWYQRIDLGDRFHVKRILLKPGARVSLQKHFHRAEHWVVVRGAAEVTVNDTVSILHENEAAYVPIGCLHRLANPGRIPLEIIEVQVGSYTGEDDIVRLEDVYGR